MALLLATSCGPAPTAEPSATQILVAATATPTEPLQTTTPATPEPSPTPIALPRCVGTKDGETIALCIPGARVDVDAAIGERDAAAIAAQVSDDLVAVQGDFEWTLRTTARVDVYATTERYASGLRTVFGYSKATADYLADSSVAFFEPSLGRIAVSWDQVRDRRPIAAIRHELTHLVTLEACAPRCDLVPAWLNEGQARLAEALIPGADWRMMRVRYEAASMVATTTVMPLTALWTQRQWNAIGDWAGYYKYQEAARAVELLRADIGDRPIARLYARIRVGDDVTRAYASLTGRSFTTFTATLNDRLAGDVALHPDVATVVPGADGHGASYLLYGFPAEAPVTIRLRSRQVDESQEIAVSPQGTYFGSIDDSYPPGAYTLTTVSGATTISVTVTKRGGRSSLMPRRD